MYFDHDFQKQKELKQDHASKTDKKHSGACKCSQQRCRQIQM